ncbi:tRNA pseudouridine synthase D [Pseudomonas matsuisoli]|uniref:tRNA pseudouridine synthase D n=1 Tax=Pseudomonas matsuisoli TaxID=1515666 RepID=A0A917PK18_9PSED|nr:tRNA pseudouridine synthase D [Pseudomonas matsuisoli]
MDIPLSGQGEHLWLRVEKRGLNTEDAVRRLSRAAGVPQRAISYAGLKDKQALTRQWFSLHLPGKADPDLARAEDDELRILRQVRHGRKLQRGAHSANGFVLRLTSLEADRSALDARLQQISAGGVPNYFGPQRFGYDGGNVATALSFAAQQELPHSRNLRSRTLSAGRSWLFNRTLAMRVAAQSWNTAHIGDLLSFTDSRSFFAAGEAECQDPRLDILDLHPTGPLWGEGDSPAAGETFVLEQKVAQAHPDLARWLTTAGLTHERRVLRLPIKGLAWHYPGPDILQLEFVLPSGCFATSVIRELVELLPVGHMDI